MVPRYLEGPFNMSVAPVGITFASFKINIAKQTNHVNFQVLEVKYR